MRLLKEIIFCSFCCNLIVVIIDMMSDRPTKQILNFNSPDDYSIGDKIVDYQTFHHLFPAMCPFQFEASLLAMNWEYFYLALSDPHYCYCLGGLPCFSNFLFRRISSKNSFLFASHPREPHEESLGSKIKICTTSSASPLSFPIHFIFFPLFDRITFFYHTRIIFCVHFSRHWSLMSF